MRRSRTAELLAMPFGKFLVIAVGVGVVVYGVTQFRKAMKRKFERPLMLEGLAAERRTSLERICSFGMAARGVVFLAMGAFFVSAGLHADPSRARGLGEVLMAFARAPFGAVLMALVALGLVSYGLYSAVVGRYGQFAGRAPARRSM